MQFEQLVIGMIPQRMEDKWFIYYEQPYLYFHRSWTGDPMYRVRLAGTAAGFEVVEALWSKDHTRTTRSTPESQAQLLDFLIANLLLRQQKPFPRPEGMTDPVPGLLQHSVAGTAYPEVQASTTKPWWRFW
jgi:hypothetical protein